MEKPSDDDSHQKQILHFEPGLDGAGVRTLAEKLTAVCDGVCAVFSENGSGYNYCIVSRHVDLRAKSREINAALGGRGGGSPEMIRGAVTADRETIAKYFEV